MPSPKKVFISYAREDSQTARRLYADLKQDGFVPWLDEYDLEAGQNWRQFIPHEIQQSDYLILLLSQRSVSKRGFVQVEQKLALEVAEEFPDFDIFVVPTRVDDCEIPPRLADINCTDLFPDYERGLDRIIRALRLGRRFDRPPAPETPPQSPRPPSVYVSYWVADNKYDWVSTFVHHLQAEIAMRLGTTDGFSIFMDPDPQSESAEVPADIIAQIESADLFIAVTSPGYFNSERCARERHTFLRHSDKLVLVEREKIDPERLTDAFNAVRPYRFWVQDRKGKPPRTLGHPKVNTQKFAGYFELINDMSHDLADQLKCTASLKNDQCSPVEETTEAKSIFLAEVTDDLLFYREDIERHLIQAGFQVVPAEPLEMTEAAIHKVLAPCGLFIQLLSAYSGKSRSDQKGKCRLQFECAQKAAKTIFQWPRPDIDLQKVDADQRSLLNERSVMNIDFEEFKTLAAEQMQIKVSETSLMQDVMVFVNAHKSDKHHAQEVGQLMADRNIDHFFPLWDGSEPELLSDLEEVVLGSDGVIVIYGHVERQWVRKQVIHCRNLNFRRDQPLRALSVYDAPVPQKQPLNLNFSNINIIDCRNGFNARKFEPFFNALAKGGVS